MSTNNPQMHDVPLEEEVGNESTPNTEKPVIDLESQKPTLASRMQSLQNDIKEWLMIPVNLFKDIAPPSRPQIIGLIIPSSILIVLFLILLIAARIFLGVRRDSASSGFDAHTRGAFIIFGDYGRRGEFNQREVAASLARWCDSHRCDFAVTTGDNLYETGIDTPDDPLLKESFEDIYLTHPSLKDLTYYHVLGNHDYGKNPEAQIEYANRDSTKWYMPSHYYQVETDDINFIFTDTTPFEHNPHPVPNPDYYNLVSSPEEKQKQIDFLESKLKQSNGKFNLVVGHHPIYSAADHGNNPSVGRHFEPLFVEYQVDAYIAGHDHNQQYLSRSNIAHFISGAASKIRPITNENHWNLKWFDENNGFMWVRVTESYLEFNAVRARDNRVLLTQRLLRKNKQ